MSVYKGNNLSLKNFDYSVINNTSVILCSNLQHSVTQNINTTFILIQRLSTVPDLFWIHKGAIISFNKASAIQFNFNTITERLDRRKSF